VLIVYLRNIAFQRTNFIKRLHFHDVHQKWGLKIFHGDEWRVRVASPLG